MEKVERRLAGWKCQQLSKGSRFALIKSTLSNLPTYFLSLFPIPAFEANQIAKLQNFLWGSLGDKPKFHLVKWATICAPLSSGGLGIRNLRLFNEALLGRLRRFGLERDALLWQVIKVKYGCVQVDQCTSSVFGPYGVSLWKHISRGWPSLSHYILYDIGDGSRVNFCKTSGVGRHLWLLVILNCSEFSKTRRQVWLSL